MKNVYDILVNFKNRAYEFYEWKKEDDIEHIKVIPSFKVSDLCLFDFMNYKVKVEADFLKLIEGKSEIFCNHLIKIIDYACIIYNDNDCLAIEFDKEGIVIGKSKLLFDESDDITSSNIDTERININYTIEKKEKKVGYYTRKETIIIDNLKRYLNTIFNKKNKDEIKYIYFECFDRKEEDAKKAYEKLKLHIDKADLVVINKLKSLVKVLKK